MGQEKGYFVVEVRVRNGKRVYGKATLERYRDVDHARQFAQYVCDKVTMTRGVHLKK